MERQQRTADKPIKQEKDTKLYTHPYTQVSIFLYAYAYVFINALKNIMYKIIQIFIISAYTRSSGNNAGKFISIFADI